MDNVRGKVGSLIVAGFSNTLPPENLRDKIENDSLGGVILFARNYRDQNQLSELTANLHRIASARLLTAVDQEGGRVVRFSEDFPTYPSAYYYGCRNDRQGYLESAILTAERLKSVGVNLNLLPVCDLAQGLAPDRHQLDATYSVLATPRLYRVGATYLPLYHVATQAKSMTW